MILQKTFSALVLSLLLFFTLLPLAYAAGPGDLDPTFGDDGIVTTTFGVDYSGGYDIAVQDDGMIVVAGVRGDAASNDDFALVRYHPDGTLDTSFGTGGMVTTPIGTSSDIGQALEIQADGKIVVIGPSLNTSDNTPDFALARYNPDGSLDTSFGSGGTVVTSIEEVDISYELVIQPDGKIVVVGHCLAGISSYFALVRYNADGSLDTGFGTNGMVLTAIGSETNEALGVALQADGKFIVVGGVSGASNTIHTTLARYQPDGSLDTGFGSGGIVTTTVGNNQDRGEAVTIQADGRIVVAGFSGVNETEVNFAVTRYHPNGSLDASFGSGGIITTSIGSYASARAVAVQANGKIVVAGYNSDGLTNSDVTLVRYQPNGSLDAGFGLGGVITTSMSSVADSGEAVVIQKDGKILVAGYSNYINAQSHFAVICYLGDPVEPDLALTKTVTPPGPVQPGQTLTYTLTFSNLGHGTATGVVLTDVIPSGQLKNLAYLSQGVTVTSTGGASYTWQIADMAPNQRGIITLTGRVDPALSANITFTNTATITGSGETITANNEAQAALAVTVPELSFNQATYQVSEAAGQAVFTLTLSSPPLAPVSVKYTTANGTALAGNDYPARSGTLTFLTGTITLTFTVPVSDDSVAEEDETLIVTLDQPSGAALAGPSSTGLTLLNDDQAGVVVTPTHLTLAENGGTSFFTLTLTSQPVASITFNLISTDLTACTVTPTPAYLSPLAWKHGISFAVSPIDDTIAEGDQSCAIQIQTSSFDPNYEDQAVADVTVTVEDDDTAGLILPLALPIVTEGSTLKYPLRLDSQPAATVVVSLSGDHELQVAPGTVLFTPLNWNKVQIVTLTASQDGEQEGAHSGVVQHSLVSADPNYHGLEVAPLIVPLVDPTKREIYLPLLVK